MSTGPVPRAVILTVLILAYSTWIGGGIRAGAQPNVTFSVTTDKDWYLVGETVHAKLIGTNLGTEPVTYTFTDGCSGFQFEIFNSSGSRVFSQVPDPGVACILTFTMVTIQPGQTLLLAVLDWSQGNASGQQVPAGLYAVTGVLHYQNPYETFSLASRTIALLSGFATISFAKMVVFDQVTVDISGTVTVDPQAKILSASVTVTVTNSTSGETIFTKTFSVLISFAQVRVRFILATPPIPFRLGVNCVVDVSAGSADCSVSRSPDVDHDGAVGLLDAGMVAFAYGSTNGSPRYNALLDLSANGAVDLIDFSVVALFFAASVYS